ncbi:MAG TPA: branched-chain amino acid aminotransferase [Saprospiraceae bacterium]|nr:branched-chain amino acid aminotransferase [Saprospiraceae bacterium]HMQ83595.1 branched-chain amino acid aminotransferase [Saprospiraceae bacterium]
MSYHIDITRTRQSGLSAVDFDNIPFGRVFSDHMFIADYEDGQWINPRIEPFARFSMHPAAMVLHYGQAIFEGMKASKSWDGKALLFRPEDHARRFNYSAYRTCMPAFPEELFLEALHTLVDLDKDWIPPQEGSALYMRPYMFANDEFIGVKPSMKYKCIIFTGPVGPYYPKPVSLIADEHYVRAAVKGGTGDVKVAGNYAASLLPAKLANDMGYDQVMWLDSNEFRYIQEVGTMNIFFVIDGTVVTPDLNGGILAGITRDSIIAILKDKGYALEERPITIDEVLEAYQAGKLQEVFGSGTAAVVAHVAKMSVKGVEMTLPPVEDRKIGEMVKQEINMLRAAKMEDTRGWIVPVKSYQLADA